MSVTNAPKEVAEGFLGMTGGDVQEAITLFMDNPEAVPPPVEASPTAEAPVLPTASIDSILNEARQAGEQQDSDKKWGTGSRLDGAMDEDEGKGSGKGKGKGKSDQQMQHIGVLFLADGFLIDYNLEMHSEDEDTEEEIAAPKPAPRRTGMMSLSDLAPSRGKGGGKGKKLPKVPNVGPLRSYDTAENKKFLDQIKEGVVPEELRKMDDQGRPVGTSIEVSDMRSTPSAELFKIFEELKKAHAEQEAEKNQSRGGTSSTTSSATMFAGAGHTLSSTSQPSTTGGQPTVGAPSGGGSADPALLALVSGRAAPTVDESKPATTLQLRLSTGARVKVRLNLDNTVADLWRVVAEHLGQAVFASSSGHELSAGFPPKPLRETSATLQAADLANASVTHRCSAAS